MRSRYESHYDQIEKVRGETRRRLQPYLDRLMRRGESQRRPSWWRRIGKKKMKKGAQ